VNRFIDHLQILTENNYCWFPHHKSFITKTSQSTFTNFYSVTALHSGYSSAIFLVKNFSNGDSSPAVAHWLTLHSWTLNCTALTRWTEHGRSSHIASERTYTEHRLHHIFYCCVTSLRTRMLRALRSNVCTRHVSCHLLYFCVWALYLMFTESSLSNESMRQNIIAILCCKLSNVISRDSAVGTVTGYWLNERRIGVLVSVVSRIFTSPRRPDRLWGPSNLLSNWYQTFFPWRYSGRGVKLTTHFQLLPRSRKRGSIHPLTHAPS
jgi:hypothetical protein